MKRRPISPAADTLRLTKPNTTGVHLIYGPPLALRTNGLQPIGKTTSAQVREAQRRMDERLEVASADKPVRNSTVTGGAPYTCPELRTRPHRNGSADAFALPSRTAFNKTTSA